MQYYVVIGKQGPQIEEVLDEVVPYYFSQAGFSSRHEAEICVKLLETTWRSPPANRYPNSLTHWEESNNPLRSVPSNPLATPSPSPNLENGQTATVNSVPSNQAPPVDTIELSEEQKQVLGTVKAGGNVFFTGPAGTGKSVLIREIIKVLRSQGKQVAVTASTGIAGVNIKGSTVHSWAGIGLGKESAERLSSRISDSIHAKLRWTATDVLIVDEISMIDGRLFDKLEAIGRLVRRKSLPFGGIQLVISGDFFQLPPVPDKSHKYKMPSVFAFDAESWPRCIKTVILLTHVFRQRDEAFIDILAAMRIGKLSDEQNKTLHALQRTINYADGMEPCHLFATKQEVQDCNQKKLNELQTPSVVYNSMDFRGTDVEGNLIEKEEAAILLDEQVALREVTLKIGAQVMLITNVIQGSLVNGSIGKVIGFMTTHQALQEHVKVVEMKQVGGLDKTEDNRVPTKRPRVEPEPEFEPLNSEQFMQHEKWPLVKFTSGLLLLCSPENFSVEGFLGNLEAKRVQVPLILAWALSMHKSQGQTLERVKVDLGKVFEHGQAYVALSRATTLAQLEIVNFNPAVIHAHPRVVAWQKQWMPQITTNSTKNSSISGPSRVPSVPARGVAASIQQTSFEDSEMDCEEAISQYHDHLLAPR